MPRAAHLLPPTATPLQDTPQVHDVKVTLDYDMAARLAAPRWTDGLQQYVDLHSDPALAIIIGEAGRQRGQHAV